MLKATDGTVYVSRCVQVDHLVTEPWEEAYLITGRPCVPECFPLCPCLEAALVAIGPWAPSALPVAYEEDEGGIETWELRRYADIAPGPLKRRISPTPQAG